MSVPYQRKADRKKVVQRPSMGYPSAVVVVVRDVPRCETCDGPWERLPEEAEAACDGQCADGIVHA